MPTSSEPVLALEVEGLSKRYLLGEHLSLQKTIEALTLRNRDNDEANLYALREVTFNVEAGEFFGIVGSNGSGKSTLTQIVSGISVPTSGRARVWGRVLPLLEVGAGFNPELTGRENIVLLAAVLGLTQKELGDAMPRIQAFSGVERHLDTPLKRYSSGMQARLSFGVAVCFPADIYIFDEVLAVVDDSFRDACAKELQRLNQHGRTIIFMSHDLDLVQSMCRTGMWLDKGRVRTTGTIAEVATAYRQETLDAASA